MADPDHPIYSGYIRDPADFVNFLKNAQDRRLAQGAVTRFPKRASGGRSAPGEVTGGLTPR